MAWLLYLGLAGGAYYAYKKLYHPTDTLALSDGHGGGTLINVEKSLPPENRTELQMFFADNGFLDETAQSVPEADDMVQKLCASLASQGYHLAAINVGFYYTNLIRPIVVAHAAAT